MFIQIFAHFDISIAPYTERERGREKLYESSVSSLYKNSHFSIFRIYLENRRSDSIILQVERRTYIHYLHLKQYYIDSQQRERKRLLFYIANILFCRSQSSTHNKSLKYFRYELDYFVYVITTIRTSSFFFFKEIFFSIHIVKTGS